MQTGHRNGFTMRHANGQIFSIRYRRALERPKRHPATWTRGHETLGGQSKALTSKAKWHLGYGFKRLHPDPVRSGGFQANSGT